MSSSLGHIEHSIDIIDQMDIEVHEILKEDYVNTVKKLTGAEISCMRLSTILAVFGFIFTGVGSVLAFSAGFWKNDYVSYASGCSSVMAMIMMKASYYANSQSHYHDSKLKNHLTKDYRFISDFVRDPYSLKPVNEPSMPDPMQIMGNDSPSSARLSPLSHVSTPPNLDFMISPRHKRSRRRYAISHILPYMKSHDKPNDGLISEFHKSPEVNEPVKKDVDIVVLDREVDGDLKIENKSEMSKTIGEPTDIYDGDRTCPSDACEAHPPKDPKNQKDLKDQRDQRDQKGGDVGVTFD